MMLLEIGHDKIIKVRRSDDDAMDVATGEFIISKMLKIHLCKKRCCKCLEFPHFVASVLALVVLH